MSKFSQKHQLRKDKMPLILAGAGILALIIFLFVVFPKDREEPDTETQFEGISEQTGTPETEERLARLEARYRALEEIVVRFEELNTSLSSRMDHIEKMLESLQKKMAVSGTAVPQPAEAPEKRTTTVRYHHVRGEDTLYRISRKYGLTVESLRRMNNLASDAVIHPGQKLIVGPAK